MYFTRVSKYCPSDYSGQPWPLIQHAIAWFGCFMSSCPGGNLREFTDEESNFAALLQRAMDLEGVDRETVYLLVGLLMKVGHASL